MQDHDRRLSILSNPSAHPLRRCLDLAAYHLYAKPRIRKTDNANVLGFRLIIPPTVFHPSLFFSSKYLGSCVARMKLEGKSVLDMGCGSGLLSLVAASKGADVTAVDINSAAVGATQENARLNALEGRVFPLEGNLFEPIPPGRRYDLVLFNPPFYNGQPANEADVAWRAGEDYAVLRAFAGSLGTFLAEGAEAVLVLSTIMDIPRVRSVFSGEGFSWNVEASRRFLFERLMIVRLTPKS